MERQSRFPLLISVLCPAGAESVEPLHRISHIQPLSYFVPSISRSYAISHDDSETIPEPKQNQRELLVNMLHSRHQTKIHDQTMHLHTQKSVLIRWALQSKCEIKIRSTAFLKHVHERWPIIPYGIIGNTSMNFSDTQKKNISQTNKKVKLYSHH